MFTNNDRDQALRLAEAQITYWQQQVEFQRVVVENEQAELAERERKLRTAKGFMELVRERYGLRVFVTPSTRFKGLALREAALKVIEERGRISPKKLIAELRVGGFEFDEYPARQLHAALLRRHQDQATKDANSYWCWVGPAQPQLPLEAKGKEAPGKK